jgi:hypothetical protein
MANVQADLHLAQLTDEELSTMGRAIATGLDGNLAFPNPVVSPAELVAAADDFDTKRKADVEAAAAASNATADMRHSRQVLHDTITRAAKGNEAQSAGDERKLRSTGLIPRKAPVRHADLKAPTGVSGSLGDLDQEVDLHWNAPRSKAVQGHRVEVTDTPQKPETFHGVAQVTGSKVTLTEQSKGVALSFRIVALGAGGKESPPSAIVTVVV